MPLDAGRLDKRITIQQATAARDSFGQAVETWSTLVETWAAISPVRGREYFAAQQLQSETTHTVTIRYRSGITAQMRVLYQSRIFRIEAVIDPAERHESLELMCVEIVA